MQRLELKLKVRKIAEVEGWWELGALPVYLPCGGETQQRVCIFVCVWLPLRQCTAELLV